MSCQLPIYSGCTVRSADCGAHGAAQKHANSHPACVFASSGTFRFSPFCYLAGLPTQTSLLAQHRNGADQLSSFRTPVSTHLTCKDKKPAPLLAQQLGVSISVGTACEAQCGPTALSRICARGAPAIHSRVVARGYNGLGILCIGKHNPALLPKFFLLPSRRVQTRRS